MFTAAPCYQLVDTAGGERRKRGIRGGPVGAQLGEARWHLASPATRVLQITADVKVDTQTGWASVDYCQIKPFLMRDLVAGVR